jgi:hypothetical protein
LQSFDLQSLDARLGKFEGIQQQYDARLAEIEDGLVHWKCFRSEFNVRLEKLNDKIDSQYKWIISLPVSMATALFRVLIRDLFTGK